MTKKTQPSGNLSGTAHKMGRDKNRPNVKEVLSWKDPKVFIMPTEGRVLLQLAYGSIVLGDPKVYSVDNILRWASVAGPER